MELSSTDLPLHQADGPHDFSRRHNVYQAPHHGVYSGIECFPPEIMSLIFCEFASENEHSSLLQQQPPWVLTHVCQRWRVIALATHTLWRHLPPLFLDGSKMPRLFEMVETLLGRSKTGSLTFLLTRCPGFDADSSEHVLVNNLATLLLSHSYRWENVQLDLSSFLAALVAGAGKLPMTRLKSVTFDASGMQQDLSLNVANGAIGLQSAKVFCHTNFSMSLNLPPAAPVTHFEANEISDGDNLAAHLGSSTRCSTLILRTNRQREGNILDLSGIPMTELLALKSITIECVHLRNRASLAALLPRLTAPDVHDMTLRLFNDYRAPREFEQFMTNSSCDIKKLVFHYHPGHGSLCGDDTLRYIVKIPLNFSLTSLRINDPQGRMIFLLCRSTDEGWEILPNLTELTVDITFRRKASPHLQRLAHTRCQPRSDIPAKQTLAGSHKLVQEFQVSATIPAQLSYLTLMGNDLTCIPDIASARTSSVTRLLEEVISEYQQHIEVPFLSPTFPSDPTVRSEFASRMDQLVHKMEGLDCDPDNALVFYGLGIDYALSRILHERQHWVSARALYLLRVRIRNVVDRWTQMLHQVPKERLPHWEWNVYGNIQYVPPSEDALPFQVLRFPSTMVDIASQRDRFVSANDYYWP